MAGKSGSGKWEINEFLESAPRAQVECRVLKHAWDSSKGTVTRNRSRYEWTMPCMRGCGTTKTVIITAGGKFLRARYRWTKTYGINGRLSKTHLGALRVLMIEGLVRN
jgi:hypothetical protein